MEFNRATRKHPRVLWEREDTKFTPWLEENIDYLNEELGTSFSVTEREQETPTGLSIDLVVEEEDTAQKGVIECQIEDSDHDHLGKLVTYSTAYESEIAVWIVKEPRYEHEKTIDWLNESTEKYFYLVKIEAIEVDGSLAPLFTPISVPSPATKEIGERKREPSKRESKQERFWEELLEKSEGTLDLFDNISPKQQGWLSKSAGKSGVFYRYRIRNEWADVGIYIGTSEKERNEDIFDRLSERQETIEEAFGDELDWQRIEDSKACRIVYLVSDDAGLPDRDEWDAIQNDLIKNMKRLHGAFDAQISDL